MLPSIQFSAAICALFHVVHSISGRHPSAALMCAGDGRDGGRFFVVANAALSAFGSRFGDGRFLCDLPLAVGVSGFFYICFAIVASLPMAGLIKFPVGKVGMVTGARFAIRLAADFALFRFGAGGSAAGVSNFLYNCTAIVASLPMPGLIKFPVGKMGMVTGARFAIRLVANLALFRFGAGGSAAGVSSFLYNRTAIVASLPMAGLIRRPAGKVGVVTGVKLAIRLAANLARFLCGAGGSTAGVGGFLYICAAS